ncbi:hypothetical protein FQN50_009482 [Emmonsiellopsis sp. PD_5]|nr:hypothetical protein FQN50_009482 [Emmonsiellopsis sp. PD_5]
MPPLEINVVGGASLNRTAERASLSVRVQSEGEKQEIVSQNVTKTVNQLNGLFRGLSPKTETGGAITIFAIGTVQSSSTIPEDNDGKPIGPRQYTASASITAIFRDFEKLSEVATRLFDEPFVSITSTVWQLTDDSREQLIREARKLAIRDAIEKANDYAEAVGREVSLVRLEDTGTHVPAGKTKQTARRSGFPPEVSHGIALEPQEIVLHVKISAKFATADWKAPAIQFDGY